MNELIKNGVSLGQETGMAGALATLAPYTISNYQLDSKKETDNKVARIYTLKDGKATIGGEGVLAGILTNPERVALQSRDYAANGSVQSFGVEGEYYAGVIGAADKNIGDAVYYIIATGELTVTAEEGKTAELNASIFRFTPSSTEPSLCIVRIKK